MSMLGKHPGSFVTWTKLKLRLHFGTKKIPYFSEREIWWASFGCNVGFEQDGKHDQFERPALVFRKFNEHVFLALPMTTREKENRFHFKTSFQGQNYTFILSQVRLLSSKRLLRKIRTLPLEEFDGVQSKFLALIKNDTPSQS